MSSVFTHKIVKKDDGTEKWIPLGKPTFPVENPNAVFPERDWPIDYQNYNLVKMDYVSKLLPKGKIIK